MVDDLQVQGSPGKGLRGMRAGGSCGAGQGCDHQLPSAVYSYQSTMALIFMYYYAMNSGAM